MMVKKRKFQPGRDWIWYAPNTTDVYSKREIDAVAKCLEEGWLSPGKYAAEFEKKISRLYGKRYGIFVNSGSSANLLAIDAMRFKPGSEIVTPACTFSTTLNPIIQLGYVPVFVDVTPGAYVADPEFVRKAISRKTAAVVVPHLIGRFADMPAFAAICRSRGISLIEDSCDTIGGSIKGKPTGVWSDITTTSFYASHVITAGGGGGMVMTNDKSIAGRVRLMRDWGRGISRHDEDIRSRLTTYKVGGEYYDSAYVFVERGYNMKPIEMQAAFGLTQLRNLKKFLARREYNFGRLRNFFKPFEKFFILPVDLPQSQTNWLAFPLTIRSEAPFSRNELVKCLEARKIQTRPLFAGNILRHPGYRDITRRLVGNLKNSDVIMRQSFLIGCHHGLTPDMLAYVEEAFNKFLSRF